MLHGMHAMWTIATDVPVLGVSVSKSLSVCHLPATCQSKSTAQIEVVFGVENPGGLRNTVLDGEYNVKYLFPHLL